MASKSESNITLQLPDGLWFRLHDWPPYNDRKSGLSRYHFKEMDFGWYNEAEDVVYLAELKDFSREIELRSKVKDLVKKAVDSLVMLHSCWCGMDGGIGLSDHLPAPARQRRPVKVFMIIRSHPDWKDDLSFIHDLFMQEFRAYAVLFDLRYSGVLSQGMAQKLFPEWVK